MCRKLDLTEIFPKKTPQWSLAGDSNNYKVLHMVFGYDFRGCKEKLNIETMKVWMILMRESRS
jgi:hypothetical protein